MTHSSAGWRSLERQRNRRRRTVAPNFTLRATPDQTQALSDLRGRPVILAFYPEDWSPVCGDQMALYNEILPEFQKFGAELLGVSVDGVWCHAAFAANRHLHFPLLADFEPKGAVARQYSAYREANGVNERALFVIDRKGVISWSYCSPIAVNPGADGILQALEDLPKQEECVAKLTAPITAEDHVQGPEDADVTLVEYGDYGCPHCGLAYPIVQKVQKKFGERLRFVFRNFPLSQMHPHAEAAAEAAEFVGAHGKFWEMHDRLFENQERLGEGLFLALVEELRLSATALRQALEQKTFQTRVRADFTSGIQSGVNGTPTFLINGLRHNGSFNFDALVSAIQQAMIAARRA